MQETQHFILQNDVYNKQPPPLVSRLLTTEAWLNLAEQPGVLSQRLWLCFPKREAQLGVPSSCSPDITSPSSKHMVRLYALGRVSSGKRVTPNCLRCLLLAAAFQINTSLFVFHRLMSARKRQGENIRKFKESHSSGVKT